MAQMLVVAPQSEKRPENTWLLHMVLRSLLLYDAMLMARGAVVSMISVIFILPALLLLCDRLVCATTLDMRQIRKSQNKAVEVTSK